MLTSLSRIWFVSQDCLAFTPETAGHRAGEYFPFSHPLHTLLNIREILSIDIQLTINTWLCCWQEIITDQFYNKW